MADSVIHDTTTNYITRAEYEARHNNLEARIIKVEGDIQSLRADVNGKIDKALEKLDGLRDDVYKYRAQSLGTALGWLISFVIGGSGLFGLLEILHVLK